jgi:hypothetical protein
MGRGVYKVDLVNETDTRNKSYFSRKPDPRPRAMALTWTVTFFVLCAWPCSAQEDAAGCGFSAIERSILVEGAEKSLEIFNHLHPEVSVSNSVSWIIAYILTILFVVGFCFCFAKYSDPYWSTNTQTATSRVRTEGSYEKENMEGRSHAISELKRLPPRDSMHL